MKTASVLALLTLGAAHAAAVAEPQNNSARTACGVPGAQCSKVKRAALAVAEAIAEAEPRIWWTACGVSGMTCAKARRSLEELGSTTEKILDDVLARDADPHAIAQKNKLFHAGFPGSSHSSKREAEPRIWWTACGVSGMTCAKAKRGAELIKEDFPGIYKDECFAPGGECHTILKAQNAFKEAVKREAEPRIWWTACGVSGMTCARGVPEAAAAKENQDPAYLKAEAECNAPGGDCTAAQSLFEQLNSALEKAVTEAHNA